MYMVSKNSRKGRLMLKSIDQFHGQSDGERVQWLQKIFRNKVIDHARKEQAACRDQRRREVLDADGGAVDWYRDGNHTLIAILFADDVRAALIFHAAPVAVEVVLPTSRPGYEWRR